MALVFSVDLVFVFTLNPGALGKLWLGFRGCLELSSDHLKHLNVHDVYSMGPE